MKKTTIAILSLLTISSLELSAQNINSFKESLTTATQPDSLGYKWGTVRIVEHGDFGAAMVKGSQSSTAKGRARGYRISIFFGNGQSARAEAATARALFAQKFPSIPSYMSYDNPYFKVTVGNCTSSEEAVTLLNKVKTVFPKSFLVRETVILGDQMK